MLSRVDGYITHLAQKGIANGSIGTLGYDTWRMLYIVGLVVVGMALGAGMFIPHIAARLFFLIPAPVLFYLLIVHERAFRLVRAQDGSSCGR